MNEATHAARSPAEIGRTEIMELRAAGVDVVFVEALGPDYFADAHLPGAVNLPPRDVALRAAALLPDRTARVVVYCSAMCTSSRDTASALIALGYLHVSVYAAGKEDWVEAGLPIERGVG